MLLCHRYGTRGDRQRADRRGLPAEGERSGRDGPLGGEHRAAAVGRRDSDRDVRGVHALGRRGPLVVSRPRSGRRVRHPARFHRETGVTLLFDAEVGREDFRGRRVTIVGLGKGRTASGLARFLVSCGASVTITDAKPREQLGEGIGRLGDTPVKLVLGPSSDDAALADPEFVFVINGVRPRSATILRALQRQIPVLTEMGLFFRLCPATIVGITGTKGKTTTTTLLDRILARGTRRVIVGGNIGTPIIQELDRLQPSDIVVLELSSFQLETIGHSPHVAVVTNILEDHLDHHGTRDAYISAKRNIVAWQGSRDIAVLNLDDPATVSLHTGSASEVRGYSLSLRPKRGAYLDAEGRLVLVSGDRRAVLCAASELRVPGRHNVANALASAIVGDVFDVGAEAIGEALREFEGVPRRLETVG